MSWVKIDDSFSDHPKLVQGGPLCKALFVDSLCWANRHLTDGFLPNFQIKTLRNMTGVTQKTVKKMLEIGLWEEVEGGYQIHDYLEYQPSAAQIQQGRRSNSQRQERFRASRNAVINSAPTQPVKEPTRYVTPSSETPVSSEGTKKKRETVVDEAFRKRMTERFGTVLGGQPGVEERIAEALSHNANKKHSDLQIYVQNWLRRDAERLGWQVPRGGRPTRAVPSTDPKDFKEF